MKVWNVIVKACKEHNTVVGVACAIGGVITTGVLAYRAGKKEGQCPSANFKDKVINAAPAIVAGATTCTGLVLLEKEHLSKQAAYVAALAFDESKQKKALEAAEKIIGKDKIEEIKANMRGEVVVPNDIPDGKALWIFDEDGDRMERSRAEILEAELEINRMLNDSGRAYITKNDARKAFGLGPVPDGKYLQWPCGETNDYGFTWIEFDHAVWSDKNGNKYFTVNFETPPTMSGEMEDYE